MRIEVGVEVPDFLETAKSEAEEALRKTNRQQVAVHLYGDGSTFVLTKGSHLWIRPSDSSKEKLTRTLVEEDGISEEAYQLGSHPVEPFERERG